MLKRTTCAAALVGALISLGSSSLLAAEPADTQAQLDAIKAAIPKFAVPMREVGDRFQNLYFAVKGGNWALAAYMGKYLNGAMNPARLTKPAEYQMWESFYKEDFAPLLKAIQAKDMKSFDATYDKTIALCNDCHKVMKYQFIKVIKPKSPPDKYIDYSLKSEPDVVPK